MNRIFHAKVEWGSFLLLAAVLLVTVHSMWVVRNGILICLMLLLLVVIIERIIHTTYTITPDGKLIVHTGRFSKDKTYDLTEVKRVEKRDGARIFGYALRSFVLLEMDNGTMVTLIPKEADKFVKHVNSHKDDE